MPRSKQSPGRNQSLLASRSRIGVSLLYHVLELFPENETAESSWHKGGCSLRIQGDSEPRRIAVLLSFYLLMIDGEDCCSAVRLRLHGSTGAAATQDVAADGASDGHIFLLSSR